MKYLPAVAIALGVGASVIAGLYITKNSECLFGLLTMIFALAAIPGVNIKDIIG